MWDTIRDICRHVQAVDGVQRVQLQANGDTLDILAVTNEHDPDITDALTDVYLTFHDRHPALKFDIDQVPAYALSVPAADNNAADFIIGART